MGDFYGYLTFFYLNKVANYLVINFSEAPNFQNILFDGDFVWPLINV